MTEERPERSYAWLWPGLASLFAGFLGWLTVVLAARQSGPAGYAEFAVVWGLYFGIGGTFAGLQQEVTRSIVRVGSRPPTGGLLARALFLGVPTALFALVIARLTGPVTGDLSWFSEAGLVVGLVGLTTMTTVNGALAADSAWVAMSWVLMGDALLRTVCVVAVLLGGASVWLSWAIGAGSWAWLLLLVSPRVRRATVARGADELLGFVRRAAAAMASTGCAAVMVAGFPLLVALCQPGELDAQVGALLATVVLVRSPVLMIVYGYRPMLLRQMLAHGPRAVRTTLGWFLAGSVVLVAASTLIGPPVLAGMLGDDYALARIDVAMISVGSAGLALLVVSGVALVAVERHGSATAGWILSLAVSAAVLIVTPSPGAGILAAVALAPLAGLLLHVVRLGHVSEVTERVTVRN